MKNGCLSSSKWGTEHVGASSASNEAQVRHKSVVATAKHFRSTISLYNELNDDLWRPLATSSDLWRPLTTSYTQCQHESNILTSRGFRKGITCLISVTFEIWSLTTSHDLKRPRIWKILVDLRNWWPQLSKNIAFEKTQKIHCSKPFSSTSSVGWNGPQTKILIFTSPHPSSISFSVFYAPHCSSCSSCS